MLVASPSRDNQRHLQTLHGCPQLSPGLEPESLTGDNHNLGGRALLWNGQCQGQWKAIRPAWEVRRACEGLTEGMAAALGLEEELDVYQL